MCETSVYRAQNLRRLADHRTAQNAKNLRVVPVSVLLANTDFFRSTTA